ncbi:hypothetical protein Vadar_008595 [Vaccinium darrowii]|uniref:Uncharacterized protein n=1 Tax=Vaccinium darrowii TaxID=229202 RepID=A0ACB7WZI4_9ERIC|nr:hypothetical protein Vadar_008595 [Vaccinium darrowii]
MAEGTRSQDFKRLEDSMKLMKTNSEIQAVALEKQTAALDRQTEVVGEVRNLIAALTMKYDQLALQICMNHILAVLKTPAKRASGFVALGEMAGALDGELLNYLPTITSHLREAIAPCRGRPSLVAMACAGSIAKAMGPAIEPHIRGLLDAMFSAGLSSTLVEALEQITVSIPSLLPTIQDRLLDCISAVLSKSQARSSIAMTRGSTTNATQQVADLSGSALVQLALQTLAHFNFKGHDLLELAQETVVVYLEDDDGATRKDAALCCCRLVSNSFSGIASAQFSSRKTDGALAYLPMKSIAQIKFSSENSLLPLVLFEMSRTFSDRLNTLHQTTTSSVVKVPTLRSHVIPTLSIVEHVVEKLLIATVADADVIVRHSIFSSLHGNVGFDDFLAQADGLCAIFVALNDEVREILRLGDVWQKKLPCCSKEAKFFAGGGRGGVDSSLGYSSLDVAKLYEGTGANANSRIISGVLVTVGDLARVGGFAMRRYIPELMPLIVDALLDGAAAAKWSSCIEYRV